MRLFVRCWVVLFCVWLAWLGALLSGQGVGVETINESFFRILHNFTVWALVRDTLVFVFAQMLVLAALGVVGFLVARGMQLLWGLRDWNAALLSSALQVFILHLFNSLLYPISATAFPVNHAWGEFLSVALLAVLFSFVLLTCLRQPRLLWCLAALALMFVVPYAQLVFSDARTPAGGEVEENPNILIIGVDALRPKDLKYFGAKYDVMPFLDGLLQRAEVFAQNYTPAARTHAAWVALLSGRYPYHNGARFNLSEDDLIDKQRLITHVLRRNGYRTVWGLDERRFNNIDESYGFDAVVGPKVGAADFLITRFSDNPIVNVLGNTRLGGFLFPYVHQNRGNYVTYVPYVFNDALVEALKSEGPVFLAAHLTLPHHPFVNHLMKRLVEDSELPVVYRNYLSMLELADRQLSDLFAKLNAEGYLDNAIVYLVSDHGEGFPAVDQGLEKGNPYSDFKVDSYGHGTNVLTLSQYHTLLARLEFKRGEVVGRGGKYDQLTSLIDIAPDLMARLGLESGYGFDGLPLGNKALRRSVVLESSYSNEAVSASRVNQLQVLQQSADAYYVAQDGRLLLQRKMYYGLSAAKQRAIIGSSGFMVALFPDERESAFVVNIKENKWWPTAAYVPDENEWRPLLGELCDFYKDDESFHQPTLCEAGK